jgi:hypothetical protein
MIMKLIAGACLAGVATVSCTSSRPTTTTPTSASSASGTAAPASTPAAGGYRPEIDPADFTTTVDNPFFPLTPGTRLTYEGVRDGAGQRDVFVVTGESKDVMGVACVVVRDTATRIKDGRLIERTDDWFAQDKAGNVWYMGEDTKLYDKKGNVIDTEGSWQGGVDGALPGIVMPGHLEVPSTYRQEYYVGHAQDMAWIVDLSQKVRVPYGSMDGVMETLEWSPLETDVIEKKYYASGIGLVFSTSAAGEVETAKLVSVTKA